MPDPIRIWVAGKPAPGGSKKGFANKKTGRVIIVDDAKGNGDWKAKVANKAEDVVPELLTQALDVTFTFFQLRPKGHYGTGRNACVLKASAPRYPTNKPDALKLARSTEDALTGVIWKDDCQTVELTTRKRYGKRPGVLIEVREMGDEPREA